MNYYQTLEFMYSQLPAYHRIGRAAYKDDLGNSFFLDDYLGHPHTGYKSIHIAGTNGKGSVSHMTASVLMESGYKTGLYTSPHLTDFRERIMVNGKMISRSAVTEFVKNHRDVIVTIKPSFFEMTVALALDYFARSGVEFAVIEAGLGGRLDSTNIISPVLSVITNIGHDHTELLGNTIEKIAYEKAGIIKPKVPLVIGETQDTTLDVFFNKASETRSDIYFSDKNFLCTLDDLDYLTGKRKFSVQDKYLNRTLEGKIPLGGDYQAKNIQTVFQIFHVLKGFLAGSDRNILEGISNTVINTHFKGRWQVIGRNPLVVCDTGHNKEGLEYVMGQVGKIKMDKLHIILGFVSDKDRNSVLPLFPSSATYYFTKATVPRALDEKILKEEAGKWGLKGSCFPDVRSAVRAALASASVNDMIFIGGSTFIVGDALKFLKI